MKSNMFTRMAAGVTGKFALRRLIHSTLACAAAAGLYAYSAARAQELDPFTFRASIDPYSVFLLPDFMIHSRERSDVIIQRSVFTPGIGGWHTHPGVSFAYVLQGHIQLQKYSEKTGCYETPVYGPGDVYVKPPNELHRAVVLGEENEVELIIRLNYPVGAAVGSPAEDPGCPAPPLVSLSANAPVGAMAAEDNDWAGVLAAPIPSFLFRGTVDPFQIHQLPDFLMHSKGPSDIVFQRTTFAHGPGAWHTHPGPSFVIVLEGELKLQKYSKKAGCYETPVYKKGDAFIEYGQQIHRPVVVSEGGDNAVVLLARFNVPVGGPASTPVLPAPNCPDTGSSN